MKTTGLLLRTIVAVFLMVTFFSLAISASGALLYGSYELGSFTLSHVRGRGIIFMLLLAGGMGFGGLVVLWSILPRVDRFVPPGPELSEDEQPTLFKEIRRVAAMTGQRPPAHVYLVADVNAFVTERGGWMGIGSQRVMGLGLGLLSILNVSELRAVIAHEFGHFHGGDTKLGPWIYKTRAAIIRTVQNLFKAGEGASESELATVGFVLTAVGKPFEWFAKLYLRITHAISRAQEYSADKMAVTSQGASALTEGLKKVHRGGMAFDLFMRSEVGPLLENKRQPPLGEGFTRFLAAEDISNQLGKAEREALEHEQQDPYDTHPPLRERIRHAESLGAPVVATDARPATALLANIPGLEARLVSSWTDGASLTPITWEKSAETYIPVWKEAQGTLATALQDATPATLPVDTQTLRTLVGRIVERDLSEVPEDELKRFVVRLYTSALSGLLVDSGFEATSSPGEAIVLRRGEVAIEPYALVDQYVSGKLDHAAWSQSWHDAGVANARVG